MPSQTSGRQAPDTPRTTAGAVRLPPILKGVLRFRGSCLVRSTQHGALHCMSGCVQCTLTCVAAQASDCCTASHCAGRHEGTIVLAFVAIVYLQHNSLLHAAASSCLHADEPACSLLYPAQTVQPTDSLQV